MFTCLVLRKARRIHRPLIAIGAAAALALIAVPQARPAETPTAEEQLKALEVRYNAEREALNDEFFKLEEQHRGKPVGLSVLHHLVSVAGGSYGFQGDNPVTNAGRQALGILAEHYAEHPDLDVFFTWMQSDPAVEKFLKRAIESPHRHVRGTARITLAKLRHAENWVPASFDQTLSLLATDPAKHAAEIDRYTKLRQRWNQVDPAASRKEALRLLDDTIENYSDVLEAPRTMYGPVLLKFDRGENDGLTKLRRRKLAELAESLRFEIEHLSVGRKAPEIAGPDAFGNDLKLSDHRGKVVVVMFSFKGCGPCEAMYPENRKLLEIYAGRPFAFVGIMGDTDVSTVQESVESKTITWPVWWDGGGTHGPLATKWNVSGWPTIYVLDPKGTIRYRGPRGDLLALAVAQLVADAEQP